VFNTWMGDPSKVILLEEMVKVVRDWRLLDNAATVGDRIVKGLGHLQVRHMIPQQLIDNNSHTTTTNKLS